LCTAAVDAATPRRLASHTMRFAAAQTGQCGPALGMAAHHHKPVAPASSPTTTPADSSPAPRSPQRRRNSDHEMRARAFVRRGATSRPQIIRLAKRGHPGTSTSSLTNLFVDEALRAEEHPGIVFRPGPTGRRAGLASGPDVWEVIDSLLSVRDSEPELADNALLAATAAATGLTDRKVRIAVRYYAAHRDEIDDRIAANREATEQAEAAWLAEQELLRGRGRAS
jgi:hypothetical protein